MNNNSNYKKLFPETYAKREKLLSSMAYINSKYKKYIPGSSILEDEVSESESNVEDEV